MNQDTLAINYKNGATRGSSSNMYILGNTIYSYGDHFPIARRLSETEKVQTGYSYVLNNDYYSSSTACQKLKVKGKIDNYLELPDCKTTKEDLDNLIFDFLEKIKEIRERQDKLKTKGVRHKGYQHRINMLLDEFKTYKNFRINLYGGNAVDFIQKVSNEE